MIGGRISTLLSWLCLMGAGNVGVWAEEEVSFSREVAPIFSKSGCNAGSCHGNAQGKGGFKLSLRGENPAQDAATLTESLPNRRVAPNDPASSLLLRKPTKQASHEGGEKFTPRSESYALLSHWIAQGAKNDLRTAPALLQLDVTPTQQILTAPEWTVQLQATATFADGSKREVSRWAVYEPSNLLTTVTPEGRVSSTQEGETTIIVRYLHLQSPVTLAFVPSRPDYVESVPEVDNFVDEAVTRKLRTLKLQPSARCDDVTFLRRTYFDVLGLPPTAEEARGFLADTAPTPEKRAHLVDALLQRPEYAEQWALRWSDLLRNEEKTLDARGVAALHDWLQQRFAEDAPLSEIARQLLTGEGSTYQNGAANYYRALRDPSTRAEATAQVFLGTRLQCAKCHNHPFEQWTQNDYYRFAALFDAVDYEMIGTQHPDKFDKHVFDGEQAVHFVKGGSFQDPRTKAAPTPGVLEPQGPALPQEEGRPRFQALADWITDPARPRFAQVQVNRVWYHLMGLGIVDPVDDFRSTNPPSNPALLEALTQEFIQQGFRLKPLVRSILLSRTYQTSSVPTPNNLHDLRNFSHPLVRRRTAEQLLDALHNTLAMPVEFQKLPVGQRSGQRAGVPRLVSKNDAPLTADDQFLICFGKPRRLISSETERRQASSLSQVFTLTSGPKLHELISSPENFLRTVLNTEPKLSPGALVETLFWRILSRPPTSFERDTLSVSLEESSELRPAAEDLTWALLNTQEFLLRP